MEWYLTECYNVRGKGEMQALMLQDFNILQEKWTHLKLRMYTVI